MDRYTQTERVTERAAPAVWTPATSASTAVHVHSLSPVINTQVCSKLSELSLMTAALDYFQSISSEYTRSM